MKKSILAFLFLFFAQHAFSQALEAFPVTDAWKEKIASLSPSKPTNSPSKKRKVLLFSVFTGFEHWCVPHTDVVIKALGEKSKAYEVIQSRDVNEFSAENLKKYDAVLLNNTCSKPTYRNLFYDMLQEENNLSFDQKVLKAAQYEDNLMKFVQNGGGLGIFHGAITFLNKSSLFGLMVGGNFDYHPVQQPIEVNLVDSTHPLVKAFGGKSFTHTDEPYFFNNAYTDINFRPLLWMDGAKINSQKEPIRKDKLYIAWIKSFGKGRVFYCSPSHNAQSFENPELLQFMLDGIQYTVGDYACDDSPLGSAK